LSFAAFLQRGTTFGRAPWTNLVLRDIFAGLSAFVVDFGVQWHHRTRQTQKILITPGRTREKTPKSSRIC